MKKVYAITSRYVSVYKQDIGSVQIVYNKLLIGHFFL